MTKMKAVCATAVLASLWFTASASAQCPANTFQGNTDFIPGNLGFIHTKSNAAYTGTTPAQRYIAMRWGCIIGSPSCDNPALVFEPSHNWMMWRRHERASDCIWIPASRISMRSGSAGGRTAFEKITDPDTSNGAHQVGDLVVTPSTTELFQAWNDLDAAWSGTSPHRSQATSRESDPAPWPTGGCTRVSLRGSLKAV